MIHCLILISDRKSDQCCSWCPFRTLAQAAGCTHWCPQCLFPRRSPPAAHWHSAVKPPPLPWRAKVLSEKIAAEGVSEPISENFQEGKSPPRRIESPTIYRTVLTGSSAAPMASVAERDLAHVAATVEGCQRYPQGAREEGWYLLVNGGRVRFPQHII